MRPAHPDLSMSDVLRAIIGAYDPKSYSAEKERLYADPLSAMLEIRAAPQDGRTLTKEQWEMVISYAQTGAETAWAVAVVAGDLYRAVGRVSRCFPAGESLLKRVFWLLHGKSLFARDDHSHPQRGRAPGSRRHR